MKIPACLNYGLHIYCIVFIFTLSDSFELNFKKRTFSELSLVVFVDKQDI